MSESEKIREVPKPPPVQETERAPAPQKTSQSAFDKVLEQSKILQQSPILQGKLLDQSSQEQKVREATKWQDKADDHKKDDDSGKQSIEKSRQKDKGTETATRQAVGRAGENKRFKDGGGSGGREGGGGGEGHGKRQLDAISKRLQDARALISSLNKDSFAGKMAQM